MPPFGITTHVSLYFLEYSNLEYLVTFHFYMCLFHYECLTMIYFFFRFQKWLQQMERLMRVYIPDNCKLLLLSYEL